MPYQRHRDKMMATRVVAQQSKYNSPVIALGSVDLPGRAGDKLLVSGLC